MKARLIISMIFLAASQPVNADPASTASFDDSVARIELAAKLDKLNYLPNLLPIILDNRDFIGLTDEQVAELEDWRKTNKEPMLAAMNQIIDKRVEIRRASLSPDISSGKLMYMQTEIFRLQRAVLKYKLSCRDRVMNTFNEENWISFYMVLADHDINITVPLQVAGQTYIQ